MLANAIPFDWQGSLGFDSTIINEFNNGPTNSQENEASFQTYLFKLSPSAIINDSATINAEFTTGYGRGGRLGDDSTVNNDATNMAGLLFHNAPSSSKSLNVNHLYAEIFGTTATYLIGRHPYNWALGAIYNDGKKPWARHTTIRDGITMKINLGNFKIEPFISKRFSANNINSNSKMEEFGTTLEYQNLESNISLGIYYAKMQNNTNSQTPTNDNGNPLGKTDVKITDFYIEKSFKDTTLSLEVPILSGTIGNAYNNGSEVTYSTQGFIFEGFHKISNKLDLIVNLGHLQGDDTPGEGEFNTLYLNPNYQIANILFRYNVNALNDSNKNVFDAYMSNSFYAKLEGKYMDDKSTWNLGLVYAKANEVAESQANDLGMEIDLNYNYQWNDEMNFHLNAGYLLAGDFFNGTEGSNQTATNSYIVSLGTLLNF